MRRLFLLALALVSPAAFADYSYTGQYLSSDLYFSTPEATCSAIFDWRQAELPGSYSYVNKGVSGTWSNNRMTCQGDRYSVSSGQLIQSNVVLGYVYRTQCGVGVDRSLTWPLGPTDANNPSDILGAPMLPPDPICVAGCMADVGDVQDCYSFQDGSSPYTFCDYQGTLNGEACSTSDEPEKPDTSDCPSGTSASGSGCTADPEPDPCETDPNAEGCSTDPGDGGDTGGGDTGGGDTGGGDTGGGDTGGGDSGGGDSGGGDSGSGDGSGDGDGSNDAGGLGCDDALTCTGDSIQCSLLAIQKAFTCEQKDALDLDGQRDQINNFLGQEQFQAEEDEEIDIGEMFSEGTRFLPSSCPSPESLSLNTNGGRTFQLSYEPLCQFASDLSYLIVAAAAVFFALYVGRASGGE